MSADRAVAHEQTILDTKSLNDNIIEAPRNPKIEIEDENDLAEFLVHENASPNPANYDFTGEYSDEDQRSDEELDKYYDREALHKITEEHEKKNGPTRLTITKDPYEINTDEMIRENRSPASPLYVPDYPEEAEHFMNDPYMKDLTPADWMTTTVQIPIPGTHERNAYYVRTPMFLRDAIETVEFKLQHERDENERLRDENLDLRLKIQANEKQFEARIKLAKLAKKRSQKIKKEDHSMGHYDKLRLQWRLIKKARMIRNKK